MEPDLAELLAKMSEANEEVSRAFIKQSIAWNNLSSYIRELQESHPTLFDHKDDANSSGRV
jgi:1-deoxy-D-xylulose 5-phosphate reductoisomerase